MNFIVNEVRKGMPIRAEPYKTNIKLMYLHLCSNFGLALRLVRGMNILQKMLTEISNRCYYKSTEV